jgi:hypothetical protein
MNKSNTVRRISVIVDIKYMREYKCTHACREFVKSQYKMFSSFNQRPPPVLMYAVTVCLFNYAITQL